MPAREAEQEQEEQGAAPRGCACGTSMVSAIEIPEAKMKQRFKSSTQMRSNKRKAKRKAKRRRQRARA
jgi:hypothetical protein